MSYLIETNGHTEWRGYNVIPGYGVKGFKWLAEHSTLYRKHLNNKQEKKLQEQRQRWNQTTKKSQKR